MSHQQAKSYWRFIKSLLIALVALLVVNVLFFLAYCYEPRWFYHRPWEYFGQVAYRFERYPAIWEGEQKADLSRPYWFFYQSPRYTRVTTDSDGNRSNYMETDRYPIVVSGDSNIWGSRMSDDETLPWQLSKLLNRPVYNGGRSGLYNSLKKDELQNVEIIIDMRTERAVMRGVFNNQGKNPKADYAPLARHDKQLIELFDHIPYQRYAPIELAWRMIKRLTADLYVVLSGGPQDYLYFKFKRKPEHFTQAVKAIHQRHKEFTAAGKRYIFVAIPSKQTLHHPDVDALTRNHIHRLTKALQQKGIETVNLLIAFEAHKAQGLFHPYDTHINANGSLIAASTIHQYLTK